MNDRLNEIEGGLERELGALLGSVNFSGYSERARLRSDDQAVRTHAATLVSGARATLAAAIKDWVCEHIPEPTRDQPLPPEPVTRHLRRLRALEKSLGELSDRIRSQPVPDWDYVWNGRTDGTDRIKSLIRCDAELIGTALGLLAAVQLIGPNDLGEEAKCAQVSALVPRADQVLAVRRALCYDSPVAGMENALMAKPPSVPERDLPDS